MNTWTCIACMKTHTTEEEHAECKAKLRESILNLKIEDLNRLYEAVLPGLTKGAKT